VVLDGGQTGADYCVVAGAVGPFRRADGRDPAVRQRDRESAI
jgi:hypothetical protein